MKRIDCQASLRDVPFRKVCLGIHLRFTRARTLEHPHIPFLSPYLLRQRLCASEVGEEVPDLFVGEFVERSFGHDRFGVGHQFVDVATRDENVLPVDAANDNDLVVLIDEKSSDDSPFVGDDGVVLEAFADFCAGVDDVQ